MPVIFDFGDFSWALFKCHRHFFQNCNGHFFGVTGTKCHGHFFFNHQSTGASRLKKICHGNFFSKIVTGTFSKRAKKVTGKKTIMGIEKKILASLPPFLFSVTVTSIESP